MKKELRFLTVASLLTATSFGAGVPGINAVPSWRNVVGATYQQDEKTALYEKFYNAVQAKNDQEAYTVGQEYLKKFTDNDQYSKYIRDWVADYDKRQKLTVFVDFYKALDGTNQAQTFDIGRRILAQNPEDLNILIGLARAAYLANFANNKQFNAEGGTHARKALTLLESGREPVNLNPNNPKSSAYAPFNNKNDTLAFLNLTLGDLALSNNNALEAANYYTKAASYDSFLKKEPSTYRNLAQAYLIEYNRLSNQFKTLYEGKDETPESKAALDNLNQVIDRLMDAHARVVVNASDAKYQTIKSESQAQLESFYKFRNPQDTAMANLPAYLQATASRPIPQPVSVTITAPATPAEGTTTGTTTTTTTTTTTNTPPANAAATPPAEAMSNTAARPVTPAASGATPARPAARTPAATPATPARPTATPARPANSTTKPSAKTARSPKRAG